VLLRLAGASVGAMHTNKYSSSPNKGGTGGASGGSKHQTHIITEEAIANLVREITDNPNSAVNNDGTTDLLIRVADDLLDQAVIGVSNLARHRGSDTIEVKDVKLYFERNFGGLSFSGYGDPVSTSVKPAKRPVQTDGHKQRLALIKKATKK